MVKKWTQEEVDYLIEHYPNTPNKELAEKLGVSIDKLNGKRRSLKLLKSDEHMDKLYRSQRISFENGLDYDLLKNTALKYSNRSDFQRNEHNIYRYAKINGVLEEVCSHMLVKSYSTPQLILRQITESLFNEQCLYNNRTLIKPYELDLYFENLGLAFEYDGSRWHQNDTIDKHKLCEQHGVVLITLVENSRDYENDVKQQLIDNLNLINKITKKKIKKSDIIKFVVNREKLIPSAQQIREICDSYDDYTKFKTEQKYIYKLLLERKLIVEFTSHMKICRTRYQLMDFEEIINKYDNYSDLAKNEPNLVQYLKRNGQDKLFEHLPKIRTRWTKKEIIDEINKYKTLVEFRENNPNCYAAAYKYGLQNELNVLIKKRTEYTIDDIKQTISKYTRFKDFTDNDSSTYSYCLRNNLNYLFEHLTKRRWWSYEELEEIVNQCKTVKQLSIEHPTAYATIRRRYKHLLTRLEKYVK